MSISPATDIVLDVARAADPARYRSAVAKLDATAGAEFSDSLRAEGAAPSTAPRATGDRPSQSAALTFRAAETAPDKAAAAYRQFEAMALANMLESAMPSDETFFGKGVAGETWKSMMIDQIAVEMAQHGGIGIADQLARSEAGKLAARQAAAAKTNIEG